MSNQDNHKLIDALHDFRNSMSNLRMLVSIWTLTDHVIMHLMGFNHTINPKTLFVSNFIFATRMGNKWSLFNRKIQGSAVDIRTDFMVYKHNRLIDALAKAKGISIAQLGRRCISLV
jgi:hypothetical protein